MLCACLFEIAKGLKFPSIRSMRNSSKKILPFVFINVTSENKINIEWNEIISQTRTRTRTHDGGDDGGVVQHGGHALTEKCTLSL